MVCAHGLLPKPSSTPLTEIQHLKKTAGGQSNDGSHRNRHPAVFSSLCCKAGLRTREQRGLAICNLANRRRVRRLPMGVFLPQWQSCAHPLAYRCGGSTGFAASPAAHLFPVSSAGRDRPVDTLQLTPDRNPDRPIIPSRFCVASLARKIMNDLHKRLLLLDAAENLPL